MVLLLTFSFTGGVYAQKTEKLTFTELRPDGTLIGNVTVNAVFLGWSQQNVSLEGNLLVLYERYYTKNSSDWTDWGLSSKQPRLEPLSLSEIYYIRLKAYSVRPREAIRGYIDNVQVVRILTIPDRQSSPYSWSKDGMSFYVMYELWAIIP